MLSKTKRVGLSLSGGGYRAAAFHLGTLKKLNELGILEKVDVMSTISGGSITGAAWSLYNGDYNSFHQKMMNDLKTKNVIRYIFTSWSFIRTILFGLLFVGGSLLLSFTFNSWLVFPILIVFFYLLFKYQFRIFPVSKVIERAYNDFFCNQKTLKDLKDKPLLAIGSSNLHTGRPFTFSKIKMSDSAYAYPDNNGPPIKFKHENFPVARSVMASSCVPFAFTPVLIAEEYYVNEKDFGRVKPVLVDGGVYDNQGIQKLTQHNSLYECDIIITSDAGGNFKDDKKYPNAISLLIRTVDLFMYRIKAVQMIQNVYTNISGKPISYFSLGWRIENSIPGFIRNMAKKQIIQPVLDAHNFQQQGLTTPKNIKMK